jgi:hypothetical protein
VFYAQDDFGGRDGRADETEVQARFVERLSRSGAKDLAHDYLEVSPEVAPERGKFAGLKLVRALATGVEPEALDEVQLPAQELTAAQRLRLRSDQVAQRLATEREQAREGPEPEQELERQNRLALEQQRQLERGQDLGLEP